MEIQRITLTKEEQQLIEQFIGESLPTKIGWQHFMPVVKKIVEISCNKDEESFLSDEYTSILETVPLAIIEDTYKAVVEFIKWYNKNNADENK